MGRPHAERGATAVGAGLSGGTSIQQSEAPVAAASVVQCAAPIDMPLVNGGDGEMQAASASVSKQCLAFIVVVGGCDVASRTKVMPGHELFKLVLASRC